MECIILFSSGRESIFNLYSALKNKNFKSITLYIVNYGQAAFDSEYKSAKYYANKYRCKLQSINIDVNIPTGIKIGNSSGTHVILRNLIFLSTIINKHYKKRTKQTYLFGATLEDRYTDGSSFFLKDIKGTLEKLYNNIVVDSYTKDINTIDVLELLVKQKFDISHLWLCGTTGEKMCGKCYKCSRELPIYKTKPYYAKIKHLWV